MSKRGLDRISGLPDEIITHILSFLPLKEAVATSILSTRWSNSWKYTPNLVFVDDPYDDPMIKMPMFSEGHKYWNIERSLKNAEWVNSVLNSYKAFSLKHLAISFYVHPKTYHQVSEWLLFAFSRRVESFKLDFKSFFFLLDLNVLSSIQSSDYRFLRELRLGDLKVSGEAMEFLLRSCSVLEGLIMKAILTSDVVIGGTLKYLEIYPLEYCDKIIKVSAPNLTRLLIYHCNLKKLFFENVPNLVEASFHLGLVPEDTMHHFANEAARLEILAITLNQPKVFLVPKMPKLNKLVLDYAYVTKTYLLPVTRLLQASPYLEEFKLEISDIDMYFARLTNNAIFKIPKHGKFQHNHLKVFEFSGFRHKAADNLALVRYIVNNCVALKEIIITPIYPAVARQFLRRCGIPHPYLYKVVDGIAEEEDALDMKKSTEQLLAGEIPHHIKLTII